MNHQPLTSHRPFLIYLLKFGGIFCLCYYGTLGVIGLAAPGGDHYVPFVQKYLDYVSWLKLSMIHATAFILSLFNISTLHQPGFVLRITGGRAVVISMSCVGYGVYSFWVAFVAANTGSFWKKVRWVAGGLVALWFINVIRITLLLVAINRGWPMPLGLDHHTWFNIFAYLLIFFLIWYYDRSNSTKISKRAESNKL